MSYALWVTEPVARITHRCDCCGRTIQPGERYQRTRGIYEDGPYVWKQCGHCCAFVRRYRTEFTADWHEGWSVDDIREWEPETSHLTAAAVATAVEYKRQWSLRWQLAPGELYPLPTLPKATGKAQT